MARAERSERRGANDKPHLRSAPHRKLALPKRGRFMFVSRTMLELGHSSLRSLRPSSRKGPFGHARRGRTQGLVAEPERSWRRREHGEAMRTTETGPNVATLIRQRSEA